MYDEDGPVVADEFYKELFHPDNCKSGKPDVTHAARALHKAVKKLRDKGRPPSAWVPFIHIGV